MKTATIATSRFETLVGDLSELVKARLSFLVLLTTLVGFLMGWQGPMNYLLLAATLDGHGALRMWRSRVEPVVGARLRCSYEAHPASPASGETHASE